jgi:hypothetical protein
MLVLTDKVLRETGLSFHEAAALMAPGDGELVIRIKQELDDEPGAPGLAHGPLVDSAPGVASPRISSPVIASRASDQHSDGRLNTAALPMSAEEIDGEPPRAA